MKNNKADILYLSLAPKNISDSIKPNNEQNDSSDDIIREKEVVEMSNNFVTRNELNTLEKNLESKIDNKFDMLSLKIDHQNDLMNEKFNTLDEKFNNINEKFNTVDEKFNTTHTQINHLDEKINNTDKKINWLIGMVILSILVPVFMKLFIK